MKVAIIGRSEILYNTALLLQEQAHRISLCITAREAPEYTRTTKDFQALAKRLGITCLITPNISEVKKIIKTSGADIAFSINYPGIIPQDVIDLFPLGILNAHGGDLPRYRGNACQAWAILNGEERIGLCIHKMVGGELDSGDIIARDYLPITINTKVTQAWEWMSERIPGMFVQAVDLLENDPAYVLEIQSKNPKDVLRCYPRKPEDGRIDWTQPAETVLRLINASNKPYAGAFCDFEGQKMIIWDAEPVRDREIFCAISGQVTRIGDGWIEVACGQGKIRITRVEVEGSKCSPVVWIKSSRKRLG